MRELLHHRSVPGESTTLESIRVNCGVALLPEKQTKKQNRDLYKSDGEVEPLEKRNKYKQGSVGYDTAKMSRSVCGLRKIVHFQFSHR